jgi:hypothetical protein
LTLGAAERRDCSAGVSRTLIALAMADASSACSASTSLDPDAETCPTLRRESKRPSTRAVDGLEFLIAA